MNPLTQSKNTTILPVLIALTLGCFGLSPQARAVEPRRTEAIQTRTRLRVMMRPSVSQLVLTIRRWGLMRWTATQPALTTPWRVGAGLLQATSPHASSHGDVATNRQGPVAGGNTAVPSSAELYDPATGLERHRQPPHRTLFTRRRCCPQAWCLLQGTITRLLSSAELYDPASGTWTATGSLPPDALITRRRCCPGKVLVAGGSIVTEPLEQRGAV